MEQPLVMHVLWTLDRRGAERMVFDLARTLPDCGFRVMVAAPGGIGSMDIDFRHAGISCMTGPGRRNPFEVLAFLSALVEQHQPAVLHTHGKSDVWGAWLSQRKRLPWMVTAHGEETKGGFVARRNRRWALRKANHVACVSDQAKRSVQQRFGLAEARTSIIRPGVDLQQFSYRGKKGLKDIPHFVTVGQIDKTHDHWTLVKALAAVKRPWTLTIVGEGPLERMVRREAESLGILPRVQFTGSTSHVSEDLAEADVFCLPSTSANHGMGLLEAAASGVPSIVSDLPLFHETFNDSALRYVRPGQVSNWTATIEDTLQSYDAALHRAAAAHAIVQQEHALENMADAYEDLYRSLLG